MKKVAYLREVKKERDSRSAKKILATAVREARDQGLASVCVVAERPNGNYSVYSSEGMCRRKLAGSLLELAMKAIND